MPAHYSSRIDSKTLRKLQRYAKDLALRGEVFQTTKGYFYTGPAGGRTLQGFKLGEDRQTAIKSIDIMAGDEKGVKVAQYAAAYGASPETIQKLARS